MKNQIKSLLLGFIITLLTISVANAQLNSNKYKLAYGGNLGADKFYHSFVLSNGHVLIGGQSDSLDWLPASTALSYFDTTGLSLRSSSKKVAYILELSANLDTILRCVAFPKGTVVNVYKFRSTNTPNQPTADLYIGGESTDTTWENIKANGSTGSNSRKRTYIAKLNGNFVNNIPTGFSWFRPLHHRNISTGGKHGFDGPSTYFTRQPWDVDATGKVVVGTGHEFDFDWSDILVLDPNTGANAVMLNLPLTYVGVDGGIQFPLLTQFSKIEHLLPLPNIGDSIYIENTKILVPRVLNGKNVFKDTTIAVSGKLPVIKYHYSTILVKNIRQGHPRSFTQQQFDTLMEDENGNFGRKGKYPLDFQHFTPCQNGDCPNSSDFQAGYLGHFSTNIYNGKIGEIVIDKRTNEVYYNFTFPVNDLAPFEKKSVGTGGSTIFNFESGLVKMDQTGKLLWWARMHKEDSFTVAGNFVDDLAIDYNNNELVTLCRSLDTGANNFWSGNQLLLNPNGEGFKNHNTARRNDQQPLYYGWIGKYRLNDGKITRSTYLGDLTPNSADTSGPKLTGLLANWPNPNAGNFAMGQSVAERVRVLPDGAVAIMGKARTRVFTTNNALQPVIPYNGTNNGYPRGEVPFVRVYDKDLNTIRYSTMLTGEWDAVGNGGDAVYLDAISVTNDSSILITGFQGRQSGSNIYTGNKIPFGNHTAIWSDTATKGITAVMAKIPVSYCLVIEQSPRDTTLCEGGSFTLSAKGISLNGGAITYTWVRGNDTLGYGQTFTKTNATLSDTGFYYCILSAGCGSVKTVAAKVLIPQQVSINGLSGDLQYCYGEKAFVKANVGTYRNSFTWTKNNILLPGFTSNFFNKPFIVGSDSGNYKVVVKGFCGVDSAMFKILVNVNDTIPVITSQPVAKTVCKGDTATFSVLATGNLSGYTWFHKGVNIASGNTLYLPVGFATDSGAVYANINTPNCGALKSDVVFLNVKSINTAVDVFPNEQFQTTTLTSMQEGADYKWINCLTRDSLSNMIAIEPKHLGQYKVLLKFNGCTDSSQCIEVTIAGVKSTWFNQSIKVYPNPTNQTLNIDCMFDPMGNISFTFADLLGRKVKQIELQKNQLQQSFQTDISSLENGIYMLQITLDQKTMGFVHIVKY